MQLLFTASVLCGCSIGHFQRKEVPTVSILLFIISSDDFLFPVVSLCLCCVLVLLLVTQLITCVCPVLQQHKSFMFSTLQNKYKFDRCSSLQFAACFKQALHVVSLAPSFHVSVHLQSHSRDVHFVCFFPLAFYVFISTSFLLFRCGAWWEALFQIAGEWFSQDILKTFYWFIE